MKRHLFDLVVLFVLASLACGYVSLAQPSYRTVTLHVWVLIVGALLMLGIVTSTSDAAPGRRGSEFDRALDAATQREHAPAELERAEREVTLACASAYDFHRRLLPQLREIAAARLERTGRSPGPDTLGRWWEILRPDVPEPADRFAPGISQDDLRALVGELERM
jgi:hypothetical protein